MKQCKLLSLTINEILRLFASCLTRNFQRSPPLRLLHFKARCSRSRRRYFAIQIFTCLLSSRSPHTRRIYSLCTPQKSVVSPTVVFHHFPQHIFLLYSRAGRVEFVLVPSFVELSERGTRQTQQRM